MTKKDLKYIGVFLIKVGKCITLELFGESEEKIRDDFKKYNMTFKKNERIVPAYEDANGDEYIEVDGKFIKL